MTDYGEFQAIEEIRKRVKHTEALVKKIFDQVQLMQTTETNIMATVQDVLNEVAAETTVEQSVITLLDSIAAQLTDVKAQLDANKVDTAALDTVINNLKANETALSDAVTRNTPSA